MKTALILCPHWDRYFPLYSMAAFSARLKRSGHDVCVVDLNKDMALADSVPFRKLPSARVHDWQDPVFVREQILPDFEPFLRSRVRGLLSQGVRVFGFSVFFCNLEVTLAMARLVKREDPRALVIFGGPHCFEPDNCVRLLREETCVDAVAFGEADHSFPGLIDDLERRGALVSRPGIMLRNDPATWRPSEDLVRDLDELPYADYSGHQLSAYVGKSLHSSRGCVRRCVFCDEWETMGFRQMSGERLYAEIAHQLERDPEVRLFQFGDSLSNGVMSRFGRFCDLAAGGGLDFAWQSLAIVRREMTRDFIERMRRGRCRSISYGIECGSAKVLKEMGKTATSPELNARVINDTTRAGIETWVLWMVGFPTETDKDFEDSLRFIEANAAAISVLHPSMFSIRNMMGPEDRAKFGLAPGDDDARWSTLDGRNTFEVRLERLRRLLMLANQLGIAVESPDGMAALVGLENRTRGDRIRWGRWGSPSADVSTWRF